MKRSSRHQRLPQVIGWAAFLCVTIVLLAMVAYSTLNRRSTRLELARLESTRDGLQVVVERLETARTQAERDRQLVLDLLGLCRSAKDIPNFQSNRIVARQQGIEKLKFYVPEGSHKLEISSTWRPTGTRDATAEVEARAVAAAGEKTWSIPLQPACGYFLTCLSDRKGGLIQWELTSNHPEFKTHTDTVPVDGFSHRGSSWSGTEVIQFPNQVERFSIRELEAAATARSGVKLMNGTLNGSRHDEQYEVVLSVRLLSVGPACVSASDAQRIITLGRQDLLMPYRGDGKYEIRIPQKNSASRFGTQ